MNLELQPVRMPNVSKSVIDGEMILYGSESEKALVLNQSSAIVWELCDGENSLEQIIRDLSVLFPENQNQMESDVLSVVDMLRDEGFVFLREG